MAIRQRKKNKVGDIFFPFGNYEQVEGILDDNISFVEFLIQFIELAICRFEYEGLPEEINCYDLERFLLENGRVIFFKDEVADKYVALPPETATNGKRDKYGHETEWTVKGVSDNGYRVSGIRDFVEFRNTPMAVSSVPRIIDFAKHLYNLDRTIDINVAAQKTPLLLKCSQNQRLTLKNAYMQYAGNMPVIYADKNFDTDSLTVLRTDAPFNAPGMYDLKVKIFNEYLTYLGISNVNYQKRERMVTDEVNRALGGILANRHRYLLMRQQAVDQINRKFGLNIKVAFNDVDVSDIMINEKEDDNTSFGGGEFDE